jgi:hypothetical protein
MDEPNRLGLQPFDPNGEFAAHKRFRLIRQILRTLKNRQIPTAHPLRPRRSSM